MQGAAIGCLKRWTQRVAQLLNRISALGYRHHAYVEQKQEQSH